MFYFFLFFFERMVRIQMPRGFPHGGDFSKAQTRKKLIKTLNEYGYDGKRYLEEYIDELNIRRGGKRITSDNINQAFVECHPKKDGILQTMLYTNIRNSTNGIVYLPLAPKWKSKRRRSSVKKCKAKRLAASQKRASRAARQRLSRSASRRKPPASRRRSKSKSRR